MSSARVVCAVAAALLFAGCGGGHRSHVARTNDAGAAPVRGLMHRYLEAMVSHDWAAVCAELTPELAARHATEAPGGDCPHALAFKSGATEPLPGMHPERAADDLLHVMVGRVVMLGDKAQIYMRTTASSDVPMLAVHVGGRWLLAQDFDLMVPIDDWVSSGRLS